MKIVCFSDIHERWDNFKLPKGDLLLFAGDATFQGTVRSITAFNHWLGTIKHNYKHGIIIIAGNHDWLFQTQPELARSLITNATYLEDESIIIEGLKIYGSPWQPEFCNWAYNLPRGDELKKKWDAIPKDIDILLTHSPIKGILDKCPDGFHAGCEELLETVHTLPNLKLAVWGHIHLSNGWMRWGKTLLVNASTCDEDYRPTNNPWIVTTKKTKEWSIK